MIAVVYKFPIGVTDKQLISMPKGAKILTVQFQNGILCLWALCDKAAPKAHREIFIHGTGHEVFYYELPYIGTVQQAGGALIWHVFDGGEL